MSDDQAMYIQKVEGPGFIQFDIYIGKKTNLHCTGVGKVLLAYASEQKQQRILSKKSFARYTHNTITSPARLSKELIKVRQKGYAIDDQEEELEVRCVAAPVFSNTGEFMAALSVVDTVGRIPDDNIDGLARHVIGAAGEVFSYSTPSLAETAPAGS